MEDFSQYTAEIMSIALRKIKVAKYHPDALIPTRKHPTDAGMDLYAFCPEMPWYLLPGAIAIISTKITVEIPEGYVGLVWPKSRNNYLIGGGVIDSSYQGEIFVKIINLSGEYMVIKHGDAIAQLLIQPIETPAIVEVPFTDIHKEKTNRGSDGGIVTQSLNKMTVANEPTWYQETLYTTLEPIDPEDEVDIY